MEAELLEKIFEEVNSHELSFCKFISINDTMRPKSHQRGVYVPNKVAEQIMFDRKLCRGENIEYGPVRISWQQLDGYTDSKFKYYGVAKDECRITCFGRGFPLLRPDNTGDLFVLIKMTEKEYSAWLLSSDEEINTFLEYYGMSPTDTNALISRSVACDTILEQEIKKFILQIHGVFPSGKVMADSARMIHERVFDHKENIIRNPDGKLVEWIQTEFKLFTHVEEALYGDFVHHGFPSMDAFVEAANSILNRRKSRAGKSLENHLARIFDGNSLLYEAQVKSEGNKKPDFIFPGGQEYHNPKYSSDKLVFLGAKTTCKDRWRQVINEADRIPVKHLFTLQQGNSPQQMEEMKAEGVVLVVPHMYIDTYPMEYRDSIMDLAAFIAYVKEKTA